MKKIIYLISLVPVLVLGQSQDQNYVKSTTYKIPTTVTIPSPALNQAVESITYFDGLGRPIQQVAKGQSGTGKNIINHIEYDSLGRQPREYLPYASQSTGLNYEASALTQVLNYPEYLGQKPWSETLFEASPLNRILKQSSPGAAWAMGSGKETKFEYKTNSGTDQVKIFAATATWNSATGLYDINLSIAGSAFYDAGQLYKTVTKNENWTAGSNNSTEEYTDKDGKIILRRSYNDIAYNTYYVYDQFDNLTYVIPPMADSPLSQLDGLCYQYKYDYRNRQVEKKMPGKQWEFIVYDKLDRIVATGPAYSPFSNFTAPNNIGWLVTKYDAFDRIAYTGWMQSATVTSAGRKILQDGRNAQVANFNETKISTAMNTTVNGVDFRYTNVAWPTGSAYHVLSVSYYDDYNYPSAPEVFDPVEGEPVYYKNTLKPKGLLTGNWTRVLETSDLTAGELSYALYDNKSRVIKTKTVNYLFGHTTVENKLDFSGKPIYTITRHARTAGADELYTKETYSYSDQDKMLVHTHQIGESGIPQLMAKNEYDELGQLIVKRVGGTDLTGNVPLQKIDYSYNIKGWLKEINKTNGLVQGTDPIDKFAFKINYETVENTVNNEIKPLFNGNIAETFWRTDSDDLKRSYGYTYDNLNRLTGSIYQKQGLATNAYNESIRYDMNGNIIGMLRNGDMDSQTTAQSIDHLEYTYDHSSPNRLVKVFDATNSSLGFDDDSDGIEDQDYDYAYDDNGNITSDQNKGITEITYNHLNLPAKIVFGSELRKIEYLYNAAGVKVRKTVTDIDLSGPVTKAYNYFQGYQYRGKTLLFFPTAAGYVNFTPAMEGGGLGGEPITPESYNYVFNYTDHVGNVRLSYGLDPLTGVLKIIEENHYYPFGLKHTNYNTDWAVFERIDGNVELRPGRPTAPPLEYKYKYNGKEFQDDLGLNLYDYGARFYDPADGRWWQADPLAESSRKFSPYVYALDNPIYFIDPDGMVAEDHKDPKKKSTSGSNYVSNTMAKGAIKGVGDRLNDYWGFAQKVFSDPKGAGVDVLVTAAGALEGSISFLKDPVSSLSATSDALLAKAMQSENPIEGMGKALGEMGTDIVALELVGAGGGRLFSTSSKTGKVSTASSTTTAVEDGLIYRVPGEGTSSGKPYIGRTKQSTPAERGKYAKDGRDRTQATVIDRYDTKKPKEGSYKEQKAINGHGGVKNLDNKRNEMSTKNFKAHEKKRNRG